MTPTMCFTLRRLAKVPIRLSCSIPQLDCDCDNDECCLHLEESLNKIVAIANEAARTHANKVIAVFKGLKYSDNAKPMAKILPFPEKRAQSISPSKEPAQSVPLPIRQNLQ